MSETHAPHTAVPAANADLSAFLMQSTSDYFLITTADGRIVSANPALLAATGWTSEDLLSHSLLDIVHPHDHARAHDVGRRLRAGARALETSWRLQKPCGDHLVAAWNVTVVDGLQYSLGRDVTEFAHTQRAYDLAMRQREILECAAGVGSWSYRQGDGALAASRGLARLLGLEVSAERITRAQLDAVSPELWPLLTGPNSIDETLKLGSKLAQVRLRLVRAPAQADGFVCGVSIDESDVVTALENAEEARLRLELALDAGRAATWQMDLDPPRLWVSAQFEGLIGRPVTIEEMLKGKGAATHPDDVGLTLACTKKLMANPGRATIEHRIVRPDGEVRWVQTLCQTLAEPGGKIHRAVALTVDVTERRALQQQLLAATRQAEGVLAQRSALLGVAPAPRSAPNTDDFDGFAELFQRFTVLMAELDHRDRELAASFTALKEARAGAEAASIAKSQFLANMSHELRTPINAIIGFGELIADDAAGREPQIAEDSARIVAAAQKLQAMINELLDLSRMEAGRMTANPRPTDIRAVLEEVAAPFAAAALAKGLALKVRADDELADVMIDAGRLAQAVRHLLDNAVKFTTAGAIRVDARRQETAAGPLLSIAIADTGIGLSASDIAHLQAPLTQADGRATRRHGGAGLGLAVARRLAELLGGALLIEGAPGAGATFTFQAPYLPVAQAQVA